MTLSKKRGSGDGPARVRGGFLKKRYLSRDWQEVEEGGTEACAPRRRKGPGCAVGMSCTCVRSSKEDQTPCKGRKGRRE